jgi:deoxyribonuclease V
MQKRFLDIQNSLRGQIDLTDGFDESELRLVAGVDCAYWEGDGAEYGVCCIVVVDYKTHEVIESKSRYDRIDIPYMPGFLAFRELPLVKETSKLLETEPNLFMFDGNGILHPRQMGIATHASFELGVPTIGVAKTFYRVREDSIYMEPSNKFGDWTPITVGGTELARAVRTRPKVKPVFVSPGNRVSLDTATRVVLSLVEKDSRIPIPTRLADIATHSRRKRIRTGLD